jgi:hypothetical protein
MDAFITLLTISVVSYLLFRLVGVLEERDRRRRQERLQKWIDEGHLAEMLERRYRVR